MQEEQAGPSSHTGSPTQCDECFVDASSRLDVYCAGSGYYIGTYCDCGPFSRLSATYPTQAAAEQALAEGKYRR